MSDRPKDWKLDCKVYVGELGYGAAKQELEEVFGRHGRLRNVWVARNPPGFAFVEFEDHRDAEDACKILDGSRINGRRVKVEMSSGKSRWGSRGPPVRRGYGGYGGGGGYGGYSGSRRRSRSRSPPVRRPRSRSRSRSNSPGKYGSWSGDKRRRGSSDRE